MASALLELSNSLAETVERAGRSVVAVTEGGQSGVSGTIWRDGVVVTAEHTIRDHNEVTIVLPNGKTLAAAVAGRDASTDLAALKVNEAKPAAASADAAQVRVGHTVLALGRRGKEGVVATHGIISALGGAWRTWHGGRIDQWFRLDLQPFTGFSGGPLVDAEGRVIGINTSGPRRSVMTIPAATVNRIVEQLLTKGRVARGYIGVGLQPVQLSDALKRGAGLERSRGLLVVMVEPDGPAEKAGLLVGDIVVALDDQPLDALGDLQAVLDPERVGKSARVRVVRGGAVREVAVTVGERKE